MSQADKDVVKAYVDAIADLDIERVGELIAGDIVIHIPGNNPISGEYRRRDEVPEYYGSMFERSRAVGGGIEVEQSAVDKALNQARGE